MTRTRLDRLGERLRAGSTERSDLIALAEYRNAFVVATDLVAKVIESSMTSFKADVSQRPSKSTQSIVAKLQREHIRLTQMQDIGGVRIIVSKIALQDRVVTKLQALFENCRIVDRRSAPQFGYRAVHVIVKQGDCFVEAQVRTRLQNVWAQSSEKLADRFGQELKYGAGHPDISQLLLESGKWAAALELLEESLDNVKRISINAIGRASREGSISHEEGRIRSEYRERRQTGRRNRAELVRFLKNVATDDDLSP